MCQYLGCPLSAEVEFGRKALVSCRPLIGLVLLVISFYNYGHMITQPTESGQLSVLMVVVVVVVVVAAGDGVNADSCYNMSMAIDDALATIS